MFVKWEHLCVCVTVPRETGVVYSFALFISFSFCFCFFAGSAQRKESGAARASCVPFQFMGRSLTALLIFEKLIHLSRAFGCTNVLLTLTWIYCSLNALFLKPQGNHELTLVERPVNPFDLWV